MSKITKKSINALMDIYKRSENSVILTLTDPENDNAVVMEIPVKTSLTIEEKGMFVNRVVNACFDADGDFQPQYLDPVFMITLLQMTTNVPVFEETAILDGDNTESENKISVVDIEKTYELCKAINLVKNVNDKVYMNLVSELKEMVQDKLAFVKQLRCSQERQMLSKAREELETGIAMVSSIGQQLNETLAKASSANDMTEAFKNMNYSELVSAIMANK